MSTQIGKSVHVALRAVIALAFLAFVPLSARAAELVMIERSGCAYCAKWDREVAPIYSKSEEGQRIPLRRFSLDNGKPDIRLVTPVRYTPTFLLVDDGREIGRITGYMDDAMFWGLLGKLTEKLPPTDAAVIKIRDIR